VAGLDIKKLDRGQGNPWEGNYSSWLEQKDAAVLAQENALRSARQPLLSMQELELGAKQIKRPSSKGVNQECHALELNSGITRT